MSLHSRERVLRTIRGEPADCVPAAPFMYDLAAVAAGVPLREYYTRAEALVHAQLTLHELVGQDVISVGSDNYYIAEGFGCETTAAMTSCRPLNGRPWNNWPMCFPWTFPTRTRRGGCR